MIEYISSEQIKRAIANLPQLVFEVTDACNLKCKYCAYGEFYNDYDQRENKKLSVKQAIQLIDYLIPYWNSNRNTASTSHIRISFYGGEPLMNFDFVEKIVDYITRKIDCPNHVFTFSMTTNAVLLHKYIDFLVDKKFHLLVSLDGNKENNSYRLAAKGKDFFEQITRNIDLLKEKYPDYFMKHVNFNSVLHDKNSVENIYDFFKNRYGKRPRIGELNTSGIRKEKLDDFHKMFQNTQTSLYQSAKSEEIETDMFLDADNYKALALYLHQYSGFVYEDYLELLYDKDKREEQTYPTGTCLPFTKKMFVTVNGKILACERIGHQFCLGQIHDDRVELNPSEIAEKYNKYFNKMKVRCERCKNSKACVQCIFSVENLENNPVCYGYMDSKMFNLFSLKQYQFLRKHPEAYRKIMEDVVVL